MTYSLYSQGASDDVHRDAIEKVTGDPLINRSRNNPNTSFSNKRHLWINEFLKPEKLKILLLEEIHFF